jgi:hypothetical protein
MRVIEWLPKPYRLTFLIAALTLALPWIAGIIYEPTRWHAVAALWDALVTGGVVWFVLEYHSERFQNRLWLRRNVRHYAMAFETIIGQSAFLAHLAMIALSIDLPDALRQQLIHSPR